MSLHREGKNVVTIAYGQRAGGPHDPRTIISHSCQVENPQQTDGSVDPGKSSR